MPAMVAVGGAILGGLLSSKKPKTGSVSTLSPQQQQLLQQLMQSLQPVDSASLGFDPNQQDPRTQALESTSLAGLEKMAMDLTGSSEPQDFLTGQLDAGKENAQFDSAVFEPELKRFQERTLPSVTARFGGNAAFGSDRMTQERQMTEDFNVGIGAERAKWLENANQRGLQASSILAGLPASQAAVLQSMLGVRTYSEQEKARAAAARLAALLGGLGVNSEQAYAVPGTDYSSLGYLSGKGLADYLQTKQARTSATNFSYSG